MPEGNDKPQLDGALLVGDPDDFNEGDAEGTAGSPGDGKAEDAATALENLISRMSLEAEVAVREDGQRIVLDVDGPDVGRIIGKKGQTLDALQFLVNKIVNRFPTGRRHVIVDSGDYRERHDNGLVSMAHREAKRAVQQGRVITLKPMSARDRRVIHLSLAKFPGVSTRSNGEGMNRRIQIIPANQGRSGGDRDRDRGDRGPGGGGGGRPQRRRTFRGGSGGGGGGGFRDGGGGGGFRDGGGGGGGFRDRGDRRGGGGGGGGRGGGGGGGGGDDRR